MTFLAKVSQELKTALKETDRLNPSIDRWFFILDEFYQVLKLIFDDIDNRHMQSYGVYNRLFLTVDFLDVFGSLEYDLISLNFNQIEESPS